MVIESMHEKTDEAMCKLLQALFRSFVITIDQMKNVSILLRHNVDRGILTVGMYTIIPLSHICVLPFHTGF